MFSVVIPLYNKAHTIERALKSVLSQTFQDFEIIIVNDGSTDNGVELVKKLTNDNRIKVIDQENQGVSVARNKGVVESKYDYIAFLDGDDEWESKYLETGYKALVKYPDAGMNCSAGFYKNHKTGKTSYRIAKKYRNEIIKINYFENPHVFSDTSSTVILKDNLEKVGYFPAEMKKNEDLAVFYNCALISDVVYIGFTYSSYYYNVENQATQLNKDNHIDICRRFNYTNELWKKLNKKNRLYKIFSKYELRHILFTYLKNKDYETLDFYLDNMSNVTKDIFTDMEVSLYRNKSLNRFSIYYVLITKLLWRLNGFPRVGS